MLFSQRKGGDMNKKITPKAWIDQMFKAKIAQNGGPIRRKKSTIEKHASLDGVKEEAKKRGWHIVEVGEQWVVICNKGTVKIVL